MKLQREIVFCMEYLSKQTTYVKNVFCNVSCSSIKIFHFYNDDVNVDQEKTKSIKWASFQIHTLRKWLIYVLVRLHQDTEVSFELKHTQEKKCSNFFCIDFKFLGDSCQYFKKKNGKSRFYKRKKQLYWISILQSIQYWQ